LQYLQELKAFLAPQKAHLHQEMFYWGAFSYDSEEHFPVALFDRKGNALPALYDLNEQ
jgi:hypothetical protein